MITTHELEDIYNKTTEKTLFLWRHNPGPGKIKEKHYHPTKLALVTGITPDCPAQVQDLLSELTRLTQHDPLADVMRKGSFHITFLAITSDIYDHNLLPGNVSEITDLVYAMERTNISISSLRLIALPDQILLAGIPDKTSLLQRDSFTRNILKSSWAPLVHSRYGNIPLPPPFWHSTLIRYQAERLPESIRQFFYNHQSIYPINISAPLRLVITDYNWSNARDITR
ncbi:hypothetical protein [Raoultella ornithinolytica]|uniref:hypothetical protein n=1 Tax=Raoultella ornithinolytica TaxID=54291 RepID=UPI0011582A4F|nr:hypothetical protein [Raoultella ornithinolytica]